MPHQRVANPVTDERLTMKHLLSCLAGFCLSVMAPSLYAATISTGPYTPSTTPFIVPILVSDAVNLASFTFDLTYDPSAYRINTACDPFSDGYCDFSTGPVTLGTFYSSVASNPPLFLPGFVYLDANGAQTGHLSGVYGAWSDSGPAPSGDGVLAFIEFFAVDGGDPTSPITVDGSSVPPSPGGTVPEPASLALFAGGLVAMTVRRRSSGRRGPVLPR